MRERSHATSPDSGCSLSGRTGAGGRLRRHGRLAALALALLASIVGCPSAALAAPFLTLTWTDQSSTETGFAVERAEGSPLLFTEIARTQADVQGYVDLNLAWETTYCYRVRAFDADGRYSDYSNEACGKTPIPPPTNLQIAVTVTSTPGSGGTVVSSPAGINCPSICAASFPRGTAVILTETPKRNSAFAGWGGACTGTSRSCVVSADAAATVTAQFVRRK